MASKSFFSLCFVGVILIVAAFYVGRFTASQSGEPRAPIEPARPDSASTAKMALPAGQHVVGFIDMPHGHPAISASKNSDVQLSGWAACVDAGSNLVKVEVLVDSKVKAGDSAFHERPDVAATYDRPDFKDSGWKASFSARELQPGEHMLTALATCSKGEVAVLPAFKLTITNE